MKGNFPKGFLLITILALPAFWYFFLQFFGENKFVLEQHGKANRSCANSYPAILVVNQPENVIAVNQLARLKQNDFTSDYLQDVSSADWCTWEADLILIDNQAYILGYYSYNISDVDRLITETELYKKIEKEGGASD